MRTGEQQHIPSAAETIATALANPESGYAKAMAASHSVSEQAETPEDRVRRLETELAALTLKINTATEAAKGGDTETAARFDLTALSCDAAEIRGKLTAARKAMEDADWQSKQESREQRKKEFEQAVGKARQSRAEFRQFFELAAAALGRYCIATESAIKLNHAIRNGAPWPDPLRTNDLADIANRASLSPLTELLDGGYKAVMSYGFDLSIKLPPLEKKEK
jgi:hypothetical protein